MRGRDAQILGLRAAADDAEHAISWCPIDDVDTGALDDTGELHARDVGRDARRRGVETGPLQQVGAVQPGTVHSDEYLVGRRRRDGRRRQLERTVRDRDCSHARQCTVTRCLDPAARVACSSWTTTAPRFRSRTVTARRFSTSSAISTRRPFLLAPIVRRGVLASVALVDLLDQAAPHPRVGELLDLADDAPTLHIFVVDRASRCRHKRWRDPLADEWRDVVPPQGPHVRR